MYLMALVATRLWTISRFSDFRNDAIRTVGHRVRGGDILFSLGSQACFIACTYKREYNKYPCRRVAPFRLLGSDRSNPRFSSGRDALAPRLRSPTYINK